MEPPTKAMRKEVAAAGFYISPWGPHSVLQILTVEDLLNGKTINRPPDKHTDVTFKQAPKARPKIAKAPKLAFDHGHSDDSTGG